MTNGFFFCYIQNKGLEISILVPWKKFLNSKLFNDTFFFYLPVSSLYWLGDRVKDWNKIIMFASKFLQKDKLSCKDGTKVKTYSRSLEMIFSTASVCRWWVYTSSDLVFDKGTHEALRWCCHCLSAARGNPSFVSQGNSTNSKKPELVNQTEPDGAHRRRWAAQI